MNSKQDLNSLQNKANQFTNILATIFALAGIFFILSALTTSLAHSPHNDELSTVEKSFQPSVDFLLAYLKRDTHPPAYYLLMMLAGKAFGQTLETLRLLSWLFYSIGSLTIGLITWKQTRQSLFYSSATFALASACPIAYNYSAFAKSYSLLYALIPILILQRDNLLRTNKNSDPKPGQALYSSTLNIIGLTHFYGFALTLAINLIDLLNSKKSGKNCLIIPNAMGLVLPTAWTASSLTFLTSNEGRETFRTSSIALLNAIGVSQLGENWAAGIFTIITLSLIAYLSGTPLTSEKFASKKLTKLGKIANINLIGASAFVLITTLVISIFKPSSGARHYIVITPSIITGLIYYWYYLSERIGSTQKKAWICANFIFLCILLISFWQHTAPSRSADTINESRHGNHYMRVASIADNYKYKMTTNCTSTKMMDKILVSSGKISGQSLGKPWICVKKSTDKKSKRSVKNALAKVPKNEEFLLTSGTRSDALNDFPALKKELRQYSIACTDHPLMPKNKDFAMAICKSQANPKP